MGQTTRKGTLYSTVALSFTIALVPASYALSPINSVNDGRIIQGGTYYNTAGNKTSFINSQSGGLWLKAGTTLRGLEVNGNGALNNNGGAVHLYAPGNVVRVDGSIDVNAIRNCQSTYLGNGGKIFIDSAYLYQNGTIFANGVNGGLVKVNVGAITLGSNAQIQAKGSTGAGGTIVINSKGPVDFRQGSLVDTSGKTFESLNRNLISIQGSLVNTEGIIRADGVSIGPGGYQGGTIRITSTGNTNLNPVETALSKSGAFTTTEVESISDRLQEFAKNQSGSIRNTSVIKALGETARNVCSYAGNGGKIILTALNDITNSQGAITVNGGTRNNHTFPQGHQPVPAGKGGSIVIKSDTFRNDNGIISADGGLGALGSNNVNTLGGDGGSVYIKTNVFGNYNISNGRISATGGDGGIGSNTLGGNGGTIYAESFPNGFSYNVGYLDANGGHGSDGRIQGNGGTITVRYITNEGNITANGGARMFSQGLGGHITLTGIENNGIITADGSTGGRIEGTITGNSAYIHTTGVYDITQVP